MVTGINSIPTVKAAENTFGNAVSQQAQNQQQGSFGAHQAQFAKEFGGLGQFNCATCTPLK
ncbi:MAG: hypothetical protein WA323_05250 [Candidatus Nitrosopolaris sp.]